MNGIKRGEIDWVKKVLKKAYVKGENPAEKVELWQQGCFPKHTYPEVYDRLHQASDELAEESKGRIQFRHNLMEDKWRFHEGLNDYLMLHWGTHTRIAGHMKRQDTDWNYSQALVPAIKDEIYIVDTPILNVRKEKISILKNEYIASQK